MCSKVFIKLIINDSLEDFIATTGITEIGR